MADIPTDIRIEENRLPKTEFMTITPRNSKFNEYSVKPIKLKVIQSKGVEVTPNVDIKVNEFNKGYMQFVNNSGNSDRFKIDIIIHKNETITGSYHISVHNEATDLKLEDIVVVGDVDLENLFLNREDIDIEDDIYKTYPLLFVLDQIIKTCTPVYVVTEAIDIENGEYIIVDNASRKQNYHDHTIWSLEFVKYNTWVVGSFKNNNVNVQKAITNYNKKKTKTTAKAKTTTTQSTTLKTKLKKCKRTTLVYSKKKKVVACVKTLQQLLNKYVGSKLTVDGWFGDSTKKAVKKFQKKYKTKYKLKETGKIDNATFKALYTGGSAAVQVGKTKKV